MYTCLYYHPHAHTHACAYLHCYNLFFQSNVITLITIIFYYISNVKETINLKSKGGVTICARCLAGNRSETQNGLGGVQ